MVEWSNWSGKIRAQPARIDSPVDEEGLVHCVLQASREHGHARVVGATHSHAPLVPTHGVLIDPSQLSGVLEVNREESWARVQAGTRISDLGTPLRDAGVALMNQGDIDRQAVAGAIATGTHGTGRSLRNFSASLLAARLVLADGRLLECSPQHEPELFEVVRLSLGAVGVLTELTLQVRPAYRLRERLWLEDLDTVLDRIDELCDATRHFEFFWMPGAKRAACKSLAETEAEPVYPLGQEGRRLAWSYEVLANDRPEKHSEMEYSLPEEYGPDCLRELRDMLATDFPDLAWPLEYRTVAEDDIWLSSARNRATVTLSVHQGVEQPDEPLFRACETVFRRYRGRPHWGKVHYQTGEDLAELHPGWADWWRVRDRWDPQGLFLNPHLEALRPAEN